MIVKCSCKHCGGHIEFESEHAGTWVDCPHCQVQTPLKLPAPIPIAPTWEEAQQQRRRNYPPEILQKKKWLSWQAGLFLLFLFGALLFVVGSLFTKEAEQTTRTIPKPRNLPPVRTMHTDTELVLVNASSDSLNGIIAYVNGMPPYGYKCEIGFIEAKGIKEVRLIDFTKSNGERFNPMAYKVTEIWIGGGGYDYGSIEMK